MDRPPEPPPHEDPWDEVELDEQFVGSAAYTEAPGLERIATARWSAHRPLAEPPAGVPAIGVRLRRRHLAARAGGAALAVAVLLAGGYVAARDAHVAMPNVTLLMGSGGTGHQSPAQHKVARATTARPLTPAGTDSDSLSDRGAGTSLGPAATGGSEQTPTPEPSATAADTPAAQALPTLAVGASGSPAPTADGATPSVSSADSQADAEATASPDDSPSPSATPSATPTPSASPSGTPTPLPSPRLP